MRKEEIKNYIYKLKREKHQLKARLKEIEKIEKIILIAIFDKEIAETLLGSIKEIK